MTYGVDVLRAMDSQKCVVCGLWLPASLNRRRITCSEACKKARNSYRQKEFKKRHREDFKSWRKALREKAGTGTVPNLTANEMAGNGSGSTPVPAEETPWQRSTSRTTGFQRTTTGMWMTR